MTGIEKYFRDNNQGKRLGENETEKEEQLKKIKIFECTCRFLSL